MLTSQHTYRKRRPREFVLLVLLASLIFCAAPALPAGAAELKARLVKKTPEGILATMPTGPVQLTYPDGRTKLLPYRSHLQPVVAKGKVYIFTTKDLEVTGIVVYDSAKGRGQTFPLPEDLKRNNYFGQPSFSPDGTKVASYFVSDHEKPSCPEKRKSEFKSYFIDRTGKRVAEPPIPRQKRQEPGSLQFSEGLAPVAETKGKVISKEGWKKIIHQKIGFKDLSGKVVIPPQFDEVGYFSEGLAPVRVGEKWGYIDKTGKIVIPLQYTRAHSFWEGLGAVNIGKKWGYGRWGFIDKLGKMLIPPQYAAVGNFSEGLAWVAVDGKFGFIDQAGKMVISPQYDHVGDFSQGVASVGKEEGGVCCGGGVRVRSWPDWELLWQSPLCELVATDVPPLAPIWETNSLAEFDPLFFDPPRFLKYQAPEPGKDNKPKP